MANWNVQLGAEFNGTTLLLTTFVDAEDEDMADVIIEGLNAVDAVDEHDEGCPFAGLLANDEDDDYDEDEDENVESD